jgi:hypothetical protein
MITTAGNHGALDYISNSILLVLEPAVPYPNAGDLACHLAEDSKLLRRESSDMICSRHRHALSF